MSQISNNKVVSFVYELHDSDGTALENNSNAMPMAYLHGHQNLLAGLEKAFEGKSEGDTLTVVLPPEEAYGERKTEAVQRVPIKHLVGQYKRLLPNMIVQVNTQSGPMNVTVLKVGKFNIDVDVNHPFAGKTLKFQVKILNVRDATPDEIAHGHAHGDGGHHH
jgi:FKBP-type peptidyl-prolyl cis-trans isomerase SlyD